MRLSEPRLQPVSVEEFQQLRESLAYEPGTDRVLNITRTWARHPDLMVAQRPYQTHVGRGSTVPQRERELAILRIGWRCQAEYEFAQHSIFGRRAGLSDDDIKRVTVGPDAAGWTPVESMVLRTVDELYDDNMVSDGLWSELAAYYSVPQLLDLLSVIGRYWTVSVVANSLGIQLEDGVSGFPD
jgi:alkylhydroperoxidase family enzyme